MAKSQKRSSREVKKPKKVKEAAAPPAAFSKGIAIGGDAAKRK
ncbi:hypothetical protein EDC64_112108 [Aquabacter spiritensis]|uniref:Uncharacterized protein n=1 Tax=Aquabacter spiritensis TaxID=933073 RepID=A0A4R3LQA4_9HYPH|nr:hypothetical protein EDC64_112108 [Aquabacter spiritensis]